MSYSVDYISRYISAENAKRIKEILAMLEAIGVDNILEQISKLWEANDNQQALINTLRTQINNVSLLFCTKEEYDSFSVKPITTLYIVYNPDDTISLFAGDKSISGTGGSGNVSVVELSREEYDGITHTINTIYIVSDGENVSFYIGDYPLGGTDVSQLEQRVSAIESQITNVNLRSLTRNEYDALTEYNTDTIYLVQETDLSTKVYVGATLLNNDGEGGGLIIGNLLVQVVNILGEYIGFTDNVIIGISEELKGVE